MEEVLCIYHSATWKWALHCVCIWRVCIISEKTSKNWDTFVFSFSSLSPNDRLDWHHRHTFNELFAITVFISWKHSYWFHFKGSAVWRQWSILLESSSKQYLISLRISGKLLQNFSRWYRTILLYSKEAKGNLLAVVEIKSCCQNSVKNLAEDFNGIILKFMKAKYNLGFLMHSLTAQFFHLMFNLSRRFDVWICLYFNYFV